jgi:predicted metal-dependent phosphoesterase TrpH
LDSYVDLHLHTSNSDGFWSPREVVNHCKTEGFSAISITDHDTIEGLDEALSEGERIGIEVIPGIEISAERSPGSMHLLGYFLNIRHRLLKERLEYLQKARAERNPKIVENLQKQYGNIMYFHSPEKQGRGKALRQAWRKVDGDDEEGKDDPEFLTELFQSLGSSLVSESNLFPPC